MLYNSTELTRRVLNFPAVRPCESVSKTTLINSLLSLCKTICSFKAFHFVFTSNKRNAHNAIRLIQVLQLFLEGFKDAEGYEYTGKSVISALLDLHVPLQKLNLLMHDCTRLDARMWMLTQGECVCRHFRAQLGSIAVSLDVVLKDGVIAWEDEVRDFGLFLICQLKRAHFEAQEDDIWASNLIESALARFENRVIPNPNDLRRVMNYLCIKKWADCNDQVKFLEDETRSGSGPAARLLGLMVYCRCVLFEHINGDTTRVENKTSKYHVGCLNPDDFKCPISLEIMVDPVTISTGHTYDRVNIIKWFKAGNPSCPKTGQRLQNLDLVPNLALKEVIKQYFQENEATFPLPKNKGSNNQISANHIADLATQEATKMVADFLSINLAMGTIREKSKAAYEIKLLTKNCAFSKACFSESGAIPYLLNLLLSKDSTVQENSMAALLNLSKHPQNKHAIIENNGLTFIIRVLKNGLRMEARHYAAATLFYLSSVQEYRGLIGNNPEAIPSLVELIRNGGDQGKKNALLSILSLLSYPKNHQIVLKAKLASILISLLSCIPISEDFVVDSLAVLATLAQTPDGAKAVLRAGVIDIVIRVLCSPSCEDSSRLVREHSVSLLLAICMHCGTEVVEVLVKNTSVMGALYSLLVDGTSRASKKARSLIGILHEYSEKSSSRSSMPRALPPDNFIHVW